jgi:hypothetical protein
MKQTDLFGMSGFVPVLRFAKGFDLDEMGYPIMGNEQLLQYGDGSVALVLRLKREGMAEPDIEAAVIRHRMALRKPSVSLAVIEDAVAAMYARRRSERLGQSADLIGGAA